MLSGLSASFHGADFLVSSMRGEARDTLFGDGFCGDDLADDLYPHCLGTGLIDFLSTTLSLSGF